MLDSAGRLEYVIQAAECGWDSELASSNWDPVSGRGELGEAGGDIMMKLMCKLLCLKFVTCVV